MPTFNVPTREEVSPANQAIFDNLEKGLGFVPNIYASFAHNETALGDYLGFSNRKSTLKTKEKEVINLVASQINSCNYCLSAHTAISKMNGFNEDQILDLRTGKIDGDEKLNALAALAQAIVINRGKTSPELLDAFYAAGYDKANLVDVIITIGEITITNLLHGVTQVPIDFPLAPSL